MNDGFSLKLDFSKADVEVLFELPELENVEWLDESEVDPHVLILC